MLEQLYCLKSLNAITKCQYQLRIYEVGGVPIICGH
jgi:hypothetical protein